MQTMFTLYCVHEQKSSLINDFMLKKAKRYFMLCIKYVIVSSGAIKLSIIHKMSENCSFLYFLGWYLNVLLVAYSLL